MSAEFERTRHVEHRGSKGSLRESLVLDRFLSKYMPRNVEIVRSSEILSADGQRSGQCDLLIKDPTAPFLLEDDDYRIAAVESVFGVIEVKSNLTTGELRDAYRKIARAKALPRTAYQEALGPQRYRRMYGSTWEHLPLIGMIFGFEGAELERLGDVMAELAEEYEDRPHLQVDSIWVLNRGSLVWSDAKTHRINVAPNPGDAFQAIKADPGQVLIQMTAHLHELFGSAWTSGLRLLDYLQQAQFGIHSKAWVPSEEDSTDKSDDRLSKPPS